MKRIYAFLTVCVLTIWLSGPANAQDEAETEEPEAEVMEDAPESGDILVLKNGDRITGFQIIRATHRHYILEGMYDPETDESLEIKVGRGQVTEVIRDNIDPVEQRAVAKKQALARQRTTVQGARLSDTLYALLETTIGDPPINAPGLTLGQVLAEINKRVDDALKPVPGLKNSAQPWKGKIGPDTTLAMFLDNELAPNYPGVAVLFDENVVRLRPKTPAEKAGPPPAAGRGGGRGGPPPAAAGRGGGRGGPPPAAGLPPA